MLRIWGVQELAHALHPGFGMAANFGIVFKDLLDQALFMLQIRCAERKAGVSGNELVAQGGDMAFELNQAVPVVGPRRINHALR